MSSFGDFLMLVLGIGGLWFGSETLIRGAMSLADRYRLSDALFGMLVLAIGTDLPELFVAFDASFRSLAGEDLSGIVIGSAIGSTVGQFALVFGIAGFIGYAPMNRKFLPRNSFFLLGGIAAVYLAAMDGVISRGEGLALIGFYATYLYVLIARRAERPEEGEEIKNMTVWKAWSILYAGLVMMLVWAEVSVVFAEDFAEEVWLWYFAVSSICSGLGS